MKDFKAAYRAGADAERKASSEWYDWLPIPAAIAVATIISSHYTLAWHFELLVLALMLVVLLGLVALCKRLIHAPKASGSSE